ncbi:MAG: DNA repair protein RecN [Myxococcales bacterium]|nr:DNA repair protein RecN [Myxococcales bacterium]
MLSSLRIQNLALIDDLEIALGPGLTILTGETGAGKSIIVGAVSLILGDRQSPELIRQGHDEGSVEALFDLTDGSPASAHLLAAGVDDMAGGQLVARRVITRAGKSRAYLNGRLATLTELKRVVGPLIDISSQHAHTSLLDVSTHREVLDRFGGLSEVLAEYAVRFQASREADQALAALRKAEQGRVERLDLIRFQLSEIDAVAPKPGEDVTLESELVVLRHATELRSATQTVEDKLYSRRGAVTDQLAELERVLGGAAHKDPSLSPLVARLESARIELEDIGAEVRSYRSRIDVDPGRLDQAEERLTQLEKLFRRFGSSCDAVIARRTELALEQATLEAFDDRVAELEAVQRKTQQAAMETAHRLSETRRRVGRRVSERLEGELRDLGMSSARLDVSVLPESTLGPHGIDRVELLFSSNVGEALLPLAKIASGGELSRIMLALKHVLAEADTVQLYVFDEVDTGVSGGVAERIGQKLHGTAQQRQALCITHLPQVACQADNHLRVYKGVDQGRTVTRIAQLDHAGRLEELAKLLAGVEVTDMARAHAAELLDRSTPATRRAATPAAA